MTAPEDHAAFKRFEAAGWSDQAASYETLTGRVTAAAAGPLLDAAGLDAGMRLLDLACGTGHVAAAAAERGAAAVGLDISAGMLARAREAYPDLELLEGDVEQLGFEADRFDAVAGGFLLNHVPRPERAVAEAVRVLGCGGRCAFSVWERPEQTRLMGIMSDAIDRAGLNRSEGVPEGPDGFRFADEDVFGALLAGAGLEDVRIDTLRLSVSLPDADALWHGLMGGTVRAAAAVVAAPEADRRRTRAAFDELAAEYRTPAGSLELPAVVKIGSGRRPG